MADQQRATIREHGGRQQLLDAVTTAAALAGFADPVVQPSPSDGVDAEFTVVDSIGRARRSLLVVVSGLQWLGEVPDEELVDQLVKVMSIDASTVGVSLGGVAEELAQRRPA